MPDPSTNLSTSAHYAALSRSMFTAFQQHDWAALNRLLADDFIFISQYDDHISKDAYKARCFDPTSNVAPFDILDLMVQGDTAAIHYRGRIGDTVIQNVELLTFRGNQITSVNVFFGRPDA